MSARIPDEETRRELETLLDEIASGSIDDLAELDPDQLAFLREHLSQEELEALLDRTSGGEDEV